MKHVLTIILALTLYFPTFAEDGFKLSACNTLKSAGHCAHTEQKKCKTAK